MFNFTLGATTDKSADFFVAEKFIGNFDNTFLAQFLAVKVQS